MGACGEWALGEVTSGKGMRRVGIREGHEERGH